MYIDEPTTGLPLRRYATPAGCADRLVESGNTVLSDQHNLDMIRNADWVIDLGPEGGDRGGGEIGGRRTRRRIANQAVVLRDWC